jgi:hypothetical protein
MYMRIEETLSGQPGAVQSPGHVPAHATAIRLSPSARASQCPDMAERRIASDPAFGRHVRQAGER